MGSLDYRISRSSRDSLHTQIAKQIEFYITVGELKAGDRLPTIREMERMLGVNRHTVRKAYNDLRVRGLLEVRRGTGVTIALETSVSVQKQRTPDIDSLMASTFEKANKLGYSPMQILNLLKIRALELDRRYPSVAVAECSASQAHDLAIELEVILGQSVIGIEIERAKATPATIPDSIKLIVVPLFHAQEIRDLAARRGIEVVVAHIGVGRRFQIAARKVLPATRPCIILRDEDSLSLLPPLIQRVLGIRKKVQSVLMYDEDAVRSIVKRSDLVFYTPPCRQLVERLISPGKKRMEVVYEFAPESMDLVRKALHR